MNERFIDSLYQSVIGELQPDFALKGVEDSFSPGSICEQAYEELRCAYDRILNRLGERDEDPDVERILHCMTVIQKEIAYQMYRYGVHLVLQTNCDDSFGYKLEFIAGIIPSPGGKVPRRGG